MDKLNYFWYEWQYGKFAASYLAGLEKSQPREDVQDVSREIRVNEERLINRINNFKLSA